MQSELMTGFLNQAGVNPLSNITIATLDDLGYTVNYSTAEKFTKSNLNPNCRCGSIRRSLFDMMHGATRQLGLRSSTQPRRRLSDEAYQMAMDYGMNILTERAQAVNSFSSSLVAAPDNGTVENATSIYVGHQLISVLVEDGGQMYGVMVMNP
jgi:hypothetical protein